jgi:hypothetical protein
MPWSGWPLRPFFFSRQKLQALAGQLQQGLQAWAAEAAQRTPEELSAELGLDLSFLRGIELGQSFLAPGFHSYLRPDGFFHQDHYTLVELNFANGLIVSNAYTEILADYHAEDPALSSVWAAPPRPFQAYLDLVEQALGPGHLEAPLIGLLSFRQEYETIHSWEKRVGDMVTLGRQLFHARGWDTVVLHEHDVVINSDGQAICREDQRSLDMIIQITMNTTFMDRPELLASDFKVWTGTKVGRAPLYSPLSGICLDKGTLPWLNRLMPKGQSFQVVIPETHPPTAEREVEYRLHRQDWVLKRAFDGKDTYAGCSTQGRIWNKVIARAISEGGYVMQRYQPMPLTTVPVTHDGEQIQWVTVSFELSPFIVAGRFAGGAVRYAPAATGLVMSPPPDNMGFALAAAV